MKLSQEKHQEILEVLNSLENTNRNSLNSFSVTEIVDFLTDSHTRFTNVCIPKIEQNFMLLIDYFQDNDNLKILFNLFLKLK